MKWLAAVLIGALTIASAQSRAERINQEGRILGPAPIVTAPILFNTAEADAVLSAMQVFPVDNPWNESVSNRPALPNSELVIAKIMSELSSSRRTLRVFFEMNFALVPDALPLRPITFVDYGDESDPGPYPIPTSLPIETWPRETGDLSLSEWQVDAGGIGGDRHAIVVQPGTGDLFETWQTRLVNDAWEASNGAKFNLNSNGLRPASWTSGDAAGLPMFPALIRYDECQRGMVEHAMRLVVKHTRREYLYPARHFASVPSTTDTNVPAMGQRLRLKASFPIPDTWSVAERAVVRGLKKYGALVADNGGFFSVSATPDDRWAADEFAHLSSISITNFEVVQSTGLAEGPRSPGAPTVSAGPDRSVSMGAAVRLEGSAVPVSYVRTEWAQYSGPGRVTFANASQPDTSATFSAPGRYVLRFAVDDGIHPIAYDAAVFDVIAGLGLSVQFVGSDVLLTWSGGTPPYTVETATRLDGVWQPLSSTEATSMRLPHSSASAFFRVK